MTENQMIQWFKNGDHPDDHVGELTLDLGKLCELKPELLDQNNLHPVLLSSIDIPPEAYYNRIEGAHVRFFRLPSSLYPEFEGVLVHTKCGYKFHEHGWIDDGSNDGMGITVCPGDWIKR